MIRIIGFVLLLGSLTVDLASASSIVETYPDLKEQLFKEPKSAYYLGFGLTPLGTVKSRFIFAANFFQVHWIRDRYDIEILNASYAVTTAQPSYVQYDSFTFRTSPKYKVLQNFSVGPLLGYEFVSYPQINARLYKNGYSSPSEPFSSKGVIYGVMVSENITYKENYFIKLNQVLYNETYSTEKTDQDWLYLYDRSELRKDKTDLENGTVFLFEVSLLF